MGYDRALKLAGAEVLAYEEFGNYQGEWLAKVRTGNGEGWIMGAFGSCPGCDEMEGLSQCFEHTPESDSCERCQRYLVELRQVGETLLGGGLYSYGEVEDLASKNLEWDLDAKQMLVWLIDNR